MVASIPVRQIRIDVPLRTTVAFLFVDRVHPGWSPWWSSLFEYLLELAPADPEWKHEPVQDTYSARPKLTDEQRAAVISFLRTAPPSEIEGHRTLRRATELSSDKIPRVELVYFREPLDQS